MKTNMGLVDRGLRATLGVALIAAAATGYIGAWGYIGVIMVAVAAVGVCPVYLPFGLSTCRSRK